MVCCLPHTSTRDCRYLFLESLLQGGQTAQSMLLLRRHCCATALQAFMSAHTRVPYTVSSQSGLLYRAGHQSIVGFAMGVAQQRDGAAHQQP